jgi:AbrB family looped-hinge helix DNA binding protein
MAGRTAKALKNPAAIKLCRVGERRQMLIPRSVIEALRLKEGDFVELTADHGRVSVAPKKQTEPDDVLTQEESRQVRHAVKQAREGKTRPWSAIKDELGL